MHYPLADPTGADIEAYDEPIRGSLAPDAIGVGRLVENNAVVERMRYGGDQHVIVVGANGKGKFTRFIAPNLLEMSGVSMLVIDTKGEIAGVTAHYRKKLGRVVVINPYGLHTDIPGYGHLKSCGFNPLAHLDPDADSFNGDAAELAEALITIEGKDPFFSRSARSMIAAIIMYVVLEVYRRVPPDMTARAPLGTMARVRELLCQDSEGPHEGNKYEGAGLAKLARVMMRTKYDGLRNKAAQFVNWGKTVDGVALTAMQQTEPFDDLPIKNDMTKNGFDFADLKRTPTTVYLILPPRQSNRHSNWLRLIITCALQNTMRARRRGEPKVVFLMDEFFKLGHLEILAENWALVRGYGIQFVPILQSVQQLEKLYEGLFETNIGMAGIVMAFSTNDAKTAQWFADRAGETTRTIITYSENINFTESSGVNTGGPNPTSNSGSSLSQGHTTNRSEIKAPVITPHTLRGLRAGFMVMVLDGEKNLIPIFSQTYFNIFKYKQRAMDNPMRGLG